MEVMNVNDQYAIEKVMSWINYAQKHKTSLKSVLERIHCNPIWELVYLWNGTCYWSYDTAMYIKDKITANKTNDPMLYLILGVIYRDTLDNMELAMEYFNLILLQQQDTCWVLPYAMYEIAATQAKNDKTNNNHIIIAEWIKCIEYYYLDNPQDKEWDTRMQSRCHLLLLSCTYNK